MLHFFELNELYFLDQHPEDNQVVYTLDDLKLNYASILHYQKDIVMAMLHDLRIRNHKAYPADLMTVNLYLNNNTGNVVSLYLPGDSAGSDASKICRRGLLDHYKMIRDCLRQHVWSACSWEFVKNYYDERYAKLTVKHRKWAETKRDKSTLNVKLSYLMAMVNNAKKALRRILEPDRKNYEDFLPANMLFSKLFEAHEDKIEEIHPWNAPDHAGLSIMKKVVVHSKVCNADEKYTIADLYDRVVLNFNANHIKSFQQQVFAASVHPVFSCISTYIIALKYTQQDDKNVTGCDQNLSTLGQSFVKSLKRFDHAQMYPHRVSEYIKRVIKRFSDIVMIITKPGKPKVPDNKISELLNKCSRPMILNRLKFNTRGKIEKSNSKVDNYPERLLLTCQEEIYTTHNYIQSLNKFERAFEIVKRSVYHGYMFRKKPIDILSKTCKSDATKTPVSTTSTTV